MFGTSIQPGPAIRLWSKGNRGNSVALVNYRRIRLGSNGLVVRYCAEFAGREVNCAFVVRELPGSRNVIARQPDGHRQKLLPPGLKPPLDVSPTRLLLADYDVFIDEQEQALYTESEVRIET